MGKGSPDGFVALTSWRGVCALSVALFHFPVIALTHRVGLIAHAYLFVDFFFVLSGFVIASAYEGRLGSGAERAKFAIRRFGRLWPLHVSILAVLVAAALGKGELGADEKHSVFAIFTNLALIHGLGVHDDLTWNGPSWSISVEAALYLLFLLLSFLPRRGLAYLALAAVGLLTLREWAPHGMASTFDFGVFRGLAGFFTGALIQRAPRKDLGLMGELAVLIAVGVFVSLGRATLLSPLVFGAAVYVFTGSRGAVTKLLETRPAVWLGERSYSIYMVHGLVVAALVGLGARLGLHRAGHGLAGPLDASLPALGLFVVATIGLSALTYALIETPGRTFFNRLSAQRRAIPTETRLA